MLRRFPLLTALLAAVLALAGCAPGGDRSETAGENIELPGTRHGVELQRIVDLLNADDDTTAADWRDRLADSFTASVSVDDVVEIINGAIRPARPFTVTAYREEAGMAVAVLAGRIGDPFELRLALDDAGRITTLRFVPISDHEAAASLDEVAERFDALASDVRILVERTAPGGAPEALIAVDRAEPAPVASAAKLWVLLALQRAISAEAGAASTDPWEHALVITDETKSLPSGVLQDRPSGSTVTVREAARLMIEVSDNTATDLLIHHLGRDAVEAAVVASGMHDPALLRPFPTTREQFELEWGDRALADRWVAGDEAERRAVLDEIAARGPTVTVADALSRPFDHRIGAWRASADDLAAVLAALDAGDERFGGDFAEILGANPGVAVDGWDAAMFKGGSQPDALSGAWRLTADDGTVLTVVVIATNDDADALEREFGEVFGLAADAIRLAR